MNTNNRSNTSENAIFRTKIQKIGRGIHEIRAYCMEYFDNSNIHGLRYFSERDLHWSERLLWLIVICVSLCLCGMLTLNIWTNWSDDPVTINILETGMAISSLVFPTITICPMRSPILWESHLSNIEIQRRNAWAHIWPRLLVPREFQNEFADESIYETFEMVASMYQLTYSLCSFENTMDCGKIFIPVLTNKGLCIAFNAFNSHDIYTDQMASGMMITKTNPNVSKFDLDKDLIVENYVKKGLELYPRHSITSGRNGALTSFFGIMGPNKDFNLYAIDDGMYLMVTMPGETLATTRNIRRIRLGEIARVSVKPKVTTTSDALRVYDPVRRQCYFDSERQLRFFRIYTQFNCEEECLANFTSLECGCVPFYMPRDVNTSICGAARIECYKLATWQFWSDSSAKSFRVECNCLPTCNSIEFNLNIERFEDEFNDWIPPIVSNSSLLNKDHYYVRSLNQRIGAFVFYEKSMDIVERLPSYTYSDFFADFGGLLGLFMGISALSIVELIYFFTLRLYLTVRPIRISILGEKFASIMRRFADSRLSRWNLKWPTKVFTDFSDNSNIHGVLYFTRRGLHWIERLWWIIAFGLSIWLCSMLVGNVWLQWQENPVKLSYSKVPISSVPFPTVTICPHIKFSKRTFDFDDFTHNQSTTLLDYADLLTDKYSLIKFEAIVYTMADFGVLFISSKRSAKFPANSSELIYETILDIALKLDEVVKDCRWRGQHVNCSEYLKPVLTDDGLCFAFNALNSHDIYTEEMAPGMQIVNSNPNVSNWNIENGYEMQSIVPQYPFPLIDAFEVTLIRNEHDFIKFFRSSNLYYNGFRVALTLPGDTVNIKSNSLQVQVSEDVQITLNPKMVKTSDGLKKYTPYHRGCFFQSEHPMRFFKTYTRTNCRVECLAEPTHVNCQCVKFSTPRNNDTAICGIGKQNCIYFHETYNEMKEAQYSRTAKEDSCKCLPACNTIDYNPVIDRVRFQNIKPKTSQSLDSNASDIKYAKLSIFFENHQIEAVTQLEMYTVTDFMSICGGLLGLFMGASALSFIEIIYFFTLRAFWTVRRDQAEDRVITIRPA